MTPPALRNSSAALLNAPRKFPRANGCWAEIGMKRSGSPPPSHEQLLQAVRRALAHAASLGVTSMQHMNPDYADIAVYSELLDRGELTTRIYAAPLITQVDDQTKIGIRHAFGSGFLRIGAVKAYADGSLGSATAYFFEPFLDQPNDRGLL